MIAEEGEKTTEVPWNVYTDDVKDSVASYGDAAIVVLSRIGGEGADLDFKETNYLALDDNEKEMLQNVAEMKKAGQVKKIVVLINSANTLQVDFLKIMNMTWMHVCGSGMLEFQESMQWQRFLQEM